MIPKDALREIMEKLLKQSRAGKVRWEREFGETLAVRFPQSTLMISFYSPESEPDLYNIVVKSIEGESVAHLDITKSSEMWPVAQELYNEAQRCVTGRYKVLRDMVKTLDSGRPIGQPIPQTVPDDDEDIPF